MAKICPLFSSSKANATYIYGSGGAVLVDVGASFTAIESALIKIGEDINNIKAVFITHEHSDHICGLKTLSKKLTVPIFASKETLDELIKQNKIDEKANLNVIEKEAVIDNVAVVKRFATSHDCEGSSGYRIILPDLTQVSVCTDLGIVTEEVRNGIKGSDIILLESNHDIKMLQNGPYPAELKLRIAGEKGHLSNTSAASELPFLLENGTSRFILSHLSEKNNIPALALRTSQSVLMGIGAKRDEDYLLYCARPKDNEIIYFSK